MVQGAFAERGVGEVAWIRMSMILSQRVSSTGLRRLFSKLPGNKEGRGSQYLSLFPTSGIVRSTWLFILSRKPIGCEERVWGVPDYQQEFEEWRI